MKNIWMSYASLSKQVGFEPIILLIHRNFDLHMILDVEKPRTQIEIGKDSSLAGLAFPQLSSLLRVYVKGTTVSIFLKKC